MDDMNEAGEKRILVFDIPVDSTATEAEQLLSDNCGPSFYVAGIVPWPGTGARVFLRRYAAKTKMTPETPLKATGADKDGRQAEALGYIEAHPNMKLRQICAGLKDLGIERSVSWVSNKRSESGATYESV
jgi:hypothetical protein